MSTSTSIEWTDATWNPVEGCSMAKGSENGGCLNCYAARAALRRPAAGLAVMRDSGPRWTGKVQLVESRLYDPMHWKKPRRVFVNSMSDLFHESLSNADILSVFQVIGKCPLHTFQILTKRPQRMLSFLKDRYWRNLGFSPAMGGNHHVALIYGEHYRENAVSFLPNVWLGTSVENFKTWDARVHLLKQTPAAVRFVSYEPALECLGCVDMSGLDLVIFGGESGPGARPCNIEWARSTRDQCRAAGCKFFMKQMGSRAGLQDRKGGVMEEWPEDLQIRELPGR